MCVCVCVCVGVGGGGGVGVVVVVVAERVDSTIDAEENSNDGQTDEDAVELERPRKTRGRLFGRLHRRKSRRKNDIQTLRRRGTQDLQKF